MATHGRLFDRPDRRTRTLIRSLSDHTVVDLRDAADIYDERGFIVPRLRPLTYELGSPVAVLFDLPTFMDRFSVTEPATEDGEVNAMLHGTESECFGPAREPAHVNLRPVGLLKSVGHVHATDGFPPYVSRVRALSHELRARQGHPQGDERSEGSSDGAAMDGPEGSDDAHLDIGEGMRNVLPLEVVSMRGYSTIFIPTPASAPYHEPQKALNSGTAAGTHATSPQAQAIAHALAEKNHLDLPHGRFEAATDDMTNTPRDVHLETVFVLNLDGLRICDRKGRYVPVP